MLKIAMMLMITMRMMEVLMIIQDSHSILHSIYDRDQVLAASSSVESIIKNHNDNELLEK